MATHKKISVDQFCVYYQVETTFVYSLREHGLIELMRSDQGDMIGFEQLADLEKYIRLHYELEINMEGLEAITHLLKRVQQLQYELRRLQQGNAQQ
ncbi:chaperone modulator CbpM [Mucilaginibacter sp. Mucisp86]|uniref:chaperone modulator CbpM n=1 Tax=Mucilaginibacter sp. Mucisp86 TaxID=3243060 RepID=UPI0039B3E5D4